MSRDKRAPEEPDYGLGGDAVAFTAESAAASTFDPPASEVPLREMADAAKAPSKSAGSAPAPPAVSTLEPLETLRAQGQRLRALHGFDRIADQIRQLPQPTPDERLLWLSASRNAVDTAMEADLRPRAVTRLKQTVHDLSRHIWPDLGRQTADYYGQMIQFAVRIRRFAEALEIFHNARGLLQLDIPVRAALVDAASSLDRTDLGASHLYIEDLAMRPRGVQEYAKIVRLLRIAIRIDPVSPDDDRLAEYRLLNNELRKVEAFDWVITNLAVAALRAGQLDEARQLCSAIKFPEASDADTLMLLGLVLYACGAWDDAIDRLSRAGDTPGEAISRQPLLLALCRLGALLETHHVVAGRDALAERLAAELTAAQAARQHTAWDLDADWVQGDVCFLLGRYEDAQRAFEAAPPRYLTWPHAVAAADAWRRVGRGEAFESRLIAWEEKRPAVAGLARLVRARLQLDQLQLEDAAVLVGATQVADPPDPWHDRDLVVVRACLAAELTFARPVAARQPSFDEIPLEGASAVVLAWLSRIACRWHLERGEFENVDARLSEAIHLVAPETEILRLEAQRRELDNPDDERAGRIFDHLANIPGALPLDGLHWALWLAGRQRHAEAQAVLEALGPALGTTIEHRLAMADCHLAAGNIELAREQLIPLAGTVWTTAPRLALFRPWQRLPRDTWTLEAAVSLHRAADMFEAARLMIAADLLELAITTIETAQQLLGDAAAAIPQAIGRLFRTAALAELANERFDSACRLDATACEYGVPDDEFAERIAAAVSGTEFASDSVLEVLCAWIGGFSGDAPSLEQVPVAVAVQRFVFIDDVTPDSSAELARRGRWTERLLEIQPDWNSLRRNRARACRRHGRYEQLLEFISAVGAPTEEDHRLRAQAYWALARYEEAWQAFLAAGETAWATCARAAARFVQISTDAQPLTAAETDELLAGLDWKTCDEALVPRVRTWRAAVLVAGGRDAAAIEVLDALPAPAEDEAVEACQVLRGVALVRLARPAEAVALWAHPADTEPRQLRQAMACLVRLGELRSGAAAEVEPDVIELRRMGASGEVFLLVEAEMALAHGNPEAARALAAEAVAAEKIEARNLLLAPCRPALQAEHEFVAARLAMSHGDLAAAERGLRAEEDRRLMPLGTRYWRAVYRVALGHVDEGRSLLESLVAQADDLAAPHAQLALVDARNGRLNDAQRHAARALELEPGQPFALLALAEVQLARGEEAEARRSYESITAQQETLANLRVGAAAWLALGQLDAAAGQFTAAEQAFRQAMSLAPQWPVAARRLALLLATQGQASSLDEAGTLLRQVAATFPDDGAVALALAVVAHRTGDDGLVAEALDRSLSLTSVADLKPVMRQQVMVWAMHAQLRARRFGPAAESLRRLVQLQPTPEFVDLLLRCRLLQALQLLGQSPLPAGALEEALEAAKEVSVSRPDDAVAGVLRGFCAALLGMTRDGELEGLSCDRDELTSGDDRLAALAVIGRALAGDEAAIGEASQQLPGDAALAERRVRLLVANRSRNAKALLAEAEALAQAPPTKQDLWPLNCDDVVLIGALVALETNQAEKARELLATWHSQGRGAERTRSLHAKLLAKQAARALRQKKLTETRRLLSSAMSVLST